MNRIHVRNTAFLLATSTFFVACSGYTPPTYDYYKLESRFVSSAQEQQSPEIIPTPLYSQVAGTTTTVAVRAPDQCSNRTTNQTTGEATAGGTVLQTNCGIEMGEIERALTRAGYNVVSWKIVDRELSRTGDASATTAAAALGAQVLFQINSLERSDKALGVDARWERTYFKTNAMETVTQPLPLTEEARAMLSSRFLQPIEEKSVPRTPAVTLDAVAIWVPTGQSMWYYRWTLADEVSNSRTRFAVHLQCDTYSGLAGCQRRAAPGGITPEESTVLAAGESVALSAGERPDDARNAKYAELFKMAFRNFVDNFARARQFAS